MGGTSNKTPAGCLFMDEVRLLPSCSWVASQTSQLWQSMNRWVSKTGIFRHPPTHHKGHGQIRGDVRCETSGETSGKQIKYTAGLIMKVHLRSGGKTQNKYLGECLPPPPLPPAPGLPLCVEYRGEVCNVNAPTPLAPLNSTGEGMQRECPRPSVLNAGRRHAT